MWNRLSVLVIYFVVYVKVNWTNLTSRLQSVGEPHILSLFNLIHFPKIVCAQNGGMLFVMSLRALMPPFPQPCSALLFLAPSHTRKVRQSISSSRKLNSSISTELCDETPPLWTIVHIVSQSTISVFPPRGATGQLCGQEGWRHGAAVSD